MTAVSVSGKVPLSFVDQGHSVRNSINTVPRTPRGTIAQIREGIGLQFEDLWVKSTNLLVSRPRVSVL